MTKIKGITEAESTPTGKIGRLPRQVREELNRRLEDGETGERLLDWLNGRPEVQAVLAAEFGGALINGQNLTNWRRGGLQHWRQQQERRELVRGLAEHAAELAGDAGGAGTGEHLSAVLVAELAAAAQATLAAVMEPGERCQRLVGLLGALTKVRRQDCAAARLAMEQARRARQAAIEQEEDEFKAKCKAQNEPIFRRAEMIELFNKPDLESQMRARELAEEEFQSIKLEPAKVPESRLIKPNQGSGQMDIRGKTPGTQRQARPERDTQAGSKVATIEEDEEKEEESQRRVGGNQPESRLIKANQGPGGRPQGEGSEFQVPSTSERPAAPKIEGEDENEDEEEMSDPVTLSQTELENARWRAEHGF
jgi:hypothetical protein